MTQQNSQTGFIKPLTLAVGIASVGLTAPTAMAQNSERATSALLEEVVVTARKREEGSQEVPLSISAFGSDQMDALKLRDLGNLAVGLPNVAMDDVGTTRGYANFSIRGLGINSSIISIDPTVGVFVDQVYLGTPGGVIFDVFDLESIEVLRGPQGILFGRNVTGGAVLMRTKKPGDSFEATFRGALEGGGDGGLNRYLMGTVGGPVTDNLAAKLTVYWNDDEGYFENEFTGNDFGAITQENVRGTVVWTPTDTSELVLRYQWTDIEGDGPTSQTHTNGRGVPGAFVNFKRDSFDFSIDEEGQGNIQSDFFVAEYNIDVDFGDGTITNIFGWRESYSENRGDIDAQPVWLFHAPSWTETEQFSNELRYNGLFAEKANVTTGLYWFENDVNYAERRELAGFILNNAQAAGYFDGGGLYDVETFGAFFSLDYDFSDNLSLTAGIRYTYETKDVRVASLSQNFDTIQTGIPSPVCNLVRSTVGEPKCEIDFEDDEDWTSWSPKLGFTYHLSDDSRVYGHWTRGFRSGGYNIRNTSFDPADTPGPFDEEQVDSFEIGYKSQMGFGKLNAAIFFNDISDMQRELNSAGPIGTIQLIRNTADAEIWGLEVDGTFALTDNLLMLASVGYIDASYTKVVSDLNEDGVIDGKDKDLDIPRAAEWTYSIGFTHDLDIGDWGYMSSRINYAYRDDSAYTDSNLGFILDQEIVDAGIDFRSNDGVWSVGIFGRNLLDDVKHGGDTQLPDDIFGVPTGGTFSPLSRGRVYGAELVYNFF